MSDDRPDPTTDATRDEGGVEVTAGRSAVEPRRGLPTETRLFAALGAFYLLLAVIYAATAYEWAGVALLGFGALFSFIAAAYFAFDLREVQADVEELEVEEATGPPTHEGLYLPHASVWPIGIGVGVALTLAGLAIGWWVLLPGGALLVHSLIGFAAQSRDRS
jgi:hypothetical protein